MNSSAASGSGLASSLSPAAVAAAVAAAAAAFAAAAAAKPAREPGSGLRGGGSASEGAAGTLDRRRSRVVDRDCTGAGAGSAGGGGGGASSSWSAVTSSAAVRAARAAARAACACPGDVSAAAAAGSHTKGLFLALPSTRQRLCPSAPNFTVPCTYKWAAAAGGSVVFCRFTDASMPKMPNADATSACRLELNAGQPPR